VSIIFNINILAERNPELVQRGSEVHISNLPPNTSQEDFYNFFKTKGEIIDVRFVNYIDSNNK